MKYNQPKGGVNVKITMLDDIVSIIAPHYCCSCGQIGQILCDSCKNDITDEPFQGCVYCRAITTQDNLCSRHQQIFQRFWCCTQRQGVAREVIDSYKFHRAISASRVLASILSVRLPSVSQVAVVPIPTTPHNIRVRGYDHMLLVAKELASLRGWQLTPLLRRRNNITQHFAKNAKERLLQAEGFFEATKFTPRDIPYLLIDDIFTTGATLDAGAKTLRQAGVETVWGAVVARQ